MQSQTGRTTLSAVEATHGERSRLADELHDVIAQNFQYILLQLEAARGVLGPESALADRHVVVAEERLKECWDELRDCIHSLTPAALAGGNLVSALGRHVAALSDAGHRAICFEVCGTPYPLAPAIELQLLRIAQEAVTNAMRHSCATRIAIELSFDADAVRLTVADNGAGFTVRDYLPTSREPSGSLRARASEPRAAAGHVIRKVVEPVPNRCSEGLGLTGMCERARRAGGELSIDSDIGRGTEVRVSIPRETAAELEEPVTQLSVADIAFS
jgi:signal transduction histidine kinase